MKRLGAWLHTLDDEWCLLLIIGAFIVATAGVMALLEIA
jgi:hypothetical protein